MHFERILVPTDFSESSRQAAAIAAELAGRSGGSIELLHVYSTGAMVLPDGTSWVPSPAEVLGARDRAEAELREARRELERGGAQVVVKVHALMGAHSVADELLERANSGDFDLVVMGTHGRTGLRRALLGSVAEQLLRRAGVPVLTVRERKPAPATAHDDAGERVSSAR